MLGPMSKPLFAAVFVAALSAGCVDLDLESLCTREPGNPSCVGDGGEDTATSETAVGTDTGEDLDSGPPDSELPDSTVTETSGDAPSETPSDTATADTTVAPTDTASSDTSVIDSTTPDTATADTATPDTAVCAAGSFICVGNNLRACNASRTGYEDVAACPAGTCSDSLGRCNYCTPGSARCSGSTVERCNSLGSSYVAAETCATPELCVSSGSGSCTAPACSSGELRCSGKNLEVCNAGRTAFGLKESCTIDCKSLACVKAKYTYGGETANGQCVELTDSTVMCWGQNNFGQAGIGSTTPSYLPKPTIAPQLAAAADLMLGAEHTCKRRADGTFACVGRNDTGQLGDGTTTNSVTAVNVTVAASSPSRVAVGRWHSCAIMSDSTIKCWGYNGSGQLGDGTKTDRPLGITVSGLTNATEIAASDDHTCARLNGGEVWCWGKNNKGQLGNGSTTDSSLPVKVGGVAAANGVTVGIEFSCAPLGDGTVKCWGDNTYGQLGDGSGLLRSGAVAVMGLTSATVVRAGSWHACAFASTNRVYCWGRNNVGQIGDSSTDDRLAPVLVSSDAKQLAVNSSGALFIVATSGELVGWGNVNGAKVPTAIVF
jgi:alpha-tubulin suppressor-like RCC1 family protein